MFDSLVLVFVHSRHSPMGRRGVQRNVEPFFMVAQLNSSAGSHKGVLIGRYTSYIFEIIDSNIILRCLRRSRQHQSFELRCHLFLMSSPPLSSHPWMCGDAADLLQLRGKSRTPARDSSSFRVSSPP